MRLSVLHRRTVSVLFIALYAFIVTPASTWHHHTVFFKGTTQKVNESAHATSIDNETGVSCKICAHHYSVFDKDSFFPQIESPKHGITQSEISISTCFAYANKIVSDRAPPGL